MSERGLPIADGAQACPFVAFEDDRDERATLPDHRHRCYAEVRPAPRALAHQEAYCLSSSFPVCPTFQDWARREAARARSDAAATARAASSQAVPPPPTPESADDDVPQPSRGAMWGAAVEPDAPPEHVTAVEPEGDAAEAPARARNGDDESGDDREGDREREPRRNPPRGWSAPPPWLASAEAASRSTAGETPEFVARRSQPGAGLAGSAADLLAGGQPPPPPRSPALSRHDAPVAAPRPRPSGDEGEPDFEGRDLPRPVVPARRPRAYDQHLGGPTGPDWERPRRYEAYPTIRTRIGLPEIPRLVYMAGAVVVLALALFFLPAILGLGAADESRATPSPGRSGSAAPSRSIAPTPTAAPTPIVYTIKSGDFLSKIAAEFGVTVDQILEANPQITNPNRIVVGQQITIPSPSPSAPEFGGSPSPSGSAAP